MKYISLALSYIFFINSAIAGLPPTTAAGQNQSNITTFNYKVPNNQATAVTGGTLIESGNSNLLVNPSFEHQTFSTGWTNSAGTFTEDTLLEIHGLKAAKLVLSAQTMSLTQDSTLYASQFADGVQGVASVRVKSDVALKVCSRSAGVTSSTLCVNVAATNKWVLYRVPFTLGATSNGISIASAGAVSGTVYIDDAFVGASEILEFCSSTLDCTDTFSAKVSGSGVVSDENVNWINGNCTSGGDTTCTFNTSIFTVAPNCSASNSQGDSSLCGVKSTSSTNFVVNCINPGVAQNARPFQILCQKQGADYIGKTAKAVASDQNTSSVGVTKGTILSFIFAGASENVSCTSTPCTIYGGIGLPAGFSVSRTSTGDYNINFPANFWNNTNYQCQSSTVSFSTSEQGGFLRPSARTNTVTRLLWRTSSGINGGADAAAVVTCFGERL